MMDAAALHESFPVRCAAAIQSAFLRYLLGDGICESMRR